MQPLVAIVILNYNGKNYLEKFLPSVVASTYPNKKIIVADNASTDDSINFLQQYHPTVELILLATNFGFAQGYNEALQQVTADYYVLLNSDVEVTPGWIEPVIKLLQADVSIAACQPKLLSYNNKSEFEYAGAAGGWIDYLGYPFNRGRLFDTIEQDHHQYDDVQEIFWCSGAAMFVQAKLYHQMGGLDGFFFAHQEEIDLCWRMQLAGYRIMYCPQSVVYHVGGGTLPKGHYRKVFLNFRNNLVMLLKNLPVSEIIWKLPLRIALDIAFAFKSLFVKDVASFRAVFNAHIAVIKWKFKANRNRTIKPKAVLQLKGVSNKSIVWQYFVLNKKRFDEIIGKNNL